MGSMRTKFDLDTAEDATALMEKENDIAKISNARDIFKTLDSNDNQQAQQAQNKEKHMRVEVKPDFLLEVRRSLLFSSVLTSSCRARTRRRS